MAALLKTTQIQEPSSSIVNMTLGSTGGVTFGAAATTNTVTSAAATALTLQSAGTTAITVDTSQNVGIGTANTSTNANATTPKFYVNGTGVAGSAQIVRNTTPGSGGALLQISATRGSDVNSYTALQNGDGVGTLNYLGTDGTQFIQAASIVSVVTGTVATNSMPSALTFNTNGGAATATERMRIDSSGNLLVGTTSAGLSATTGVGINSNSNAFYISVGHPTGTAAGATYQSFSYNGTAIGSVTQSGTTGVAYNVSSDYRLKENVTPINGGLATVSALKPVTYDWISDKSEGEGFIAHELQAIIPHAVTGTKDAVDADGKPVYQGIDYSKIVVHLVAAIQEQQATIASLTTRIATLEAK
jgi:hypothetical protein